MAKYNIGYGLDNGLQGLYPLPILAARAPVATDTSYPIGQTWIRTTTNQAWILTSITAGAATWALSSPGATDVDTLTGDGGGAIPPLLGNITLAGGTNITTVGAVNTITFNLDPAIVLATSITSPLYTAAGADVQLTAPANFSVVAQLGDAAGVTRFSVTDSTAAEVWGVDSNGLMGVVNGLVVAGAFAQTAGTFNVGQDNAANAINIGGGTTARAIGIGNTAAAHLVTVGSVNTTAATTIQSGTGDLALTSTDAVTIDAVGVLEINSSAGVIGLGNDAIAQNINIGTGAAARVITIGNVTGVSAVNINTGTVGAAITTTNGAFAVATGTGAINLGVDAVAHTITLGNIIGATGIALNSGTNGIGLTSTGAGDITLASGDTVLIDGAGVVEINSSAGVIGIGNDAVAQAINIGTGAAARTITIGNASAASSVIVNGGTGAMSFGANAIAHITTIGNQIGASSTIIDAGTGDLLLTSTDAIVSGATGDMTFDSVGVMTMNSSGAAISIGDDANAFAINLGTGAAARTITIGNGTGVTSIVINNGTGALNIGTNATVHTTTVGSTTGASRTVIQSGAGKIDFAGVVEELTADFVDVSGDKITFRASPIAQSILDTCVIPTGVAGTTDLLAFENGMIMEQFVIGTQSIFAPRMGAAALGLTVSCDLTNAEGKEYNFGAARTSSKHSFTIGTSAAFFMELRFRANDVSSVEPAYFGFRETAANNAAYAAYNEFVFYGLNDGVSPGDCAISTRKAGGVQADTDTNDAFADNSVHTLRIMVSAAGVVTFMFDGAPPTATQAFTFTNGIVVHPCWTHLFNATVGAGDEIYWVSMEVGFQ